MDPIIAFFGGMTVYYVYDLYTTYRRENVDTDPEDTLGREIKRNYPDVDEITSRNGVPPAALREPLFKPKLTF